MKTYRPYAPEQAFLLPPSPQDWLPEGHLAYFVLDLVGELDLGAITRRVQAKDPRGERPYAPRMMTALLLYGYAAGVFSSRKLERIRAIFSRTSCAASLGSIDRSNSMITTDRPS